MVTSRCVMKKGAVNSFFISSHDLTEPAGAPYPGKHSDTASIAVPGWFFFSLWSPNLLIPYRVDIAMAILRLPKQW